MTTNEAELWQRARRNEGAAFAALFDLHRDRVYRRALRLLGQVHDAEDVTAAAFFELWRKRASVRIVDGSVLPWLLVTTVNLSRNAHRSTARYRRVLQALPREEAFVAEADPEIRQRLDETLEQLPPVDAALLVLTALEDMPVTDAAETLGLTPGAARVRLHRARARLRLDLTDLRPATERNIP